jgi:hypothetical protein
VGGFALVVGALAVGILAGAAWSWRLPGGGETTAAATATVVGFSLAAGIDWMWELTVVSLIGVVALALAATGSSELDEPAGPGRAGVAAAVGLAAVALVATAANGAALVTSAHLAESEDAVIRGDLVRALERAESARAVQPWAASPHLQRALVEEQAGRPRAARRSIESAIERSPDDWRLWLVRSRLETVSGDVAAARGSLLRAAELNPRSPLFSDVAP